MPAAIVLKYSGRELSQDGIAVSTINSHARGPQVEPRCRQYLFHRRRFSVFESFQKTRGVGKIIFNLGLSLAITCQCFLTIFEMNGRLGWTCYKRCFSIFNFFHFFKGLFFINFSDFFKGFIYDFWVMVSGDQILFRVLYISFDRFLLAVESRDLSQADKSIT